MIELDNYIKSVKILLVEDESETRSAYAKILNKISDNVDISENGVNAFLKFQENLNNKTPYDLVISDINMPKMNGIELAKKIKEYDDDLAIIFITARNEKDILLEAIELNISSFMIKPIDFALLYENIKKISKKLYTQKQLISKQKELSTYTSIIESVAVISKTDLEGYITYVDDAFCKVSGYTKEELIGKNHNIVRHPDNPKEVYKNLWETIQEGKTWEAKVRNIDKEGNPWYAKSTIFPVFDDSHTKIIEYIAIRFIITEEHDEKRELNSKLIKNTISYKKEVAKNKKEIEKLNKHISLQNSSIQEFSSKIEKLTLSKNKLLSQVSEYEKNSIHKKDDKLEILKRKNDELQSRIRTIEKLKEEKEKQQEYIKDLEHSLEIKENVLESYKKTINEYKIQLGKVKKEKEKEPEKKGFFG